MTGPAADASAKFDGARAADYAVQARIALAGYDACHELSTCMLAAALGPGRAARLLVVGAGGTGQEIVTAGALEPAWTFTALDPSPPMLAMAAQRIEEAGLLDRTRLVPGVVDDLPADEDGYDAATLVGVLHHLPGDEPKRALLRSIAARLRPGAPLILAGNRMAYTEHPLLLAAWSQRWRLHGATPDEVQAKLGTILHGADPPPGEAAVAGLLHDAGFGPPAWFFTSLFWGAAMTRRGP